MYEQRKVRPLTVAREILKLRNQGKLPVRRYGDKYFYVRALYECVEVLLMFEAMYFVIGAEPFRIVVCGEHLGIPYYKLQTHGHNIKAMHVVHSMLQHHHTHATVEVADGSTLDLYFKDDTVREGMQKCHSI